MDNMTIRDETLQEIDESQQLHPILVKITVEMGERRVSHMVQPCSIEQARHDLLALVVNRLYRSVQNETTTSEEMPDVSGLLAHLKAVILGAESAHKGADSPENDHLMGRCMEALVEAIPDIDAALAAHREQQGGEPALPAWTGWACQYPGKLPRLYGAREIAEANCDRENRDTLIYLQSSAAQPQVPDSYAAGANDARHELKQLCKDFSDLRDRPYMGDVYAAIDGVIDMMLSAAKDGGGWK